MFPPQKQTEWELMAMKDRPALGGRCRLEGPSPSLLPQAEAAPAPGPHRPPRGQARRHPTCHRSRAGRRVCQFSCP